MKGLILLLLVSGCYSPQLSDRQFSCSAGLCPDGLTCICGACQHDPTPRSCEAKPDMSLAGDLAAADLATLDLVSLPQDLRAAADMMAPPPDGPPGMACTNGPRSAGDPGLMRIAFCPAAWLVPGINSVAAMSPACGRMPTPSGKNAAQVNCSAEDNCGPGWHVCNDEAEMTARGFNVGHCTAYGATEGLWATRLRGGPPSMGQPPQCGTTPNRAVFGCGMIGMPPQSCSLLQKALLDPPGGADECSNATSGVWQCPGLTMTAGEGEVVIKTNTTKGGVICCSDF
jgi:hypothetical protein